MGLALLTLFVLAIRLTFAFQTPFYTSDDAYLHVRSITNIQEGNLLYDDPLGYGGRNIHLSALFDVIIGLFTFLIPTTITLKLIPNIFASLLVIPVFFLAYTLTNNSRAAYTAAILAGIIPPFISTTFNHLSPLSLAIPLFFFLSYLWTRVPKHVIPYLACLLILSFLHPLAVVFVLSIGVYILLLILEHQKPTMAEYELGLFSLFFTLWAQFILYKKPILFHGPHIIWQNIPKDILATFFSNITILQAAWQLGILLLIGGTYAFYKTTVKKPHRHTQFLLSIALVSLILLWLKLIKLSLGLMLLGITFAILFAYALIELASYIKKTKLSHHTTAILTGISVLALLTTAYPAYTATTTQLQQTITHEEVHALNWLNNNTASDATIITPSNYGHYVTAIAQRPVVIDSHYLLQPRINERYNDIKRLYATSLQTEALQLFNKYSATHLIVPPSLRDISYGETKCFDRIWATNIQIYARNPECKLTVVT